MSSEKQGEELKAVECGLSVFRVKYGEKTTENVEGDDAYKSYEDGGKITILAEDAEEAIAKARKFMVGRRSSAQTEEDTEAGHKITIEDIIIDWVKRVCHVEVE
jgi:hypothetical protein